MSLRNKFLIFIFIVIVFPFMVILVYLFRSLSIASKEAESKSLEQTSNLVKQDLVNHTNGTAQIYDLMFKQMIIGLEEIKERIIEDGFKADYISRYYYKYQFISSISYINQKGEIFLFPEEGEWAGKEIDLASIEEYSFIYKNKNKFSGRWIGKHTDFKTNKDVVTYLVPIYQEDEFYGVLAFDIFVDNLFTGIASLDPSKKSYVFFVNPDKSFISSSDQIYQDFGIKNNNGVHLFDSQIISKNEFVDILPVSSRKEGSSEFIGGGNSNLLLAYSLVPSFQGKLFVVSPLDEILAIQSEKARAIEKAVKKSVITAVYFVGGFAIVLVLCVFIFSGKYIISPIQKLKQNIENFEKMEFNMGDIQDSGGNSNGAVNAIHNVRNGNLLQFGGGDEVKGLTSAFNILEGKIRTYKKNIVEQIMALKDAKDQISAGWVQLQSEKAKLTASLDSLSVGIVMIDNGGKVFLANPAACAIIGKPHQEDCNTATLQEYFQGIDLGNLIHKTQTEEKHFDIPEVQVDTRFVHLFITPIVRMTSTKAILGSVILIEDVTEQKILQRSRDEFFSIASHELRTPLTAIKGNSSLIEQFYGDKLNDPDLKEMISDIHQSSERLIGIVNDFLDMGRLEQGKMVFKNQTIDIVALIKPIVSEYQAACAEKKLSLNFKESTSILPQVYADSDKLKQVLINLMGNAMKFVKEGGVTISTQQVDGFVKVIVADTGSGISVENQNLLFRKFQQAGDSLLTRDTSKGTGLGLYISKLIINGMGGEIRLESSIEEKGSVFSFTVPIVTDADKKKEQVTQVTDIATGLQTKNTT